MSIFFLAIVISFVIFFIGFGICILCVQYYDRDEKKLDKSFIFHAAAMTCSTAIVVGIVSITVMAALVIKDYL